MIKCCSPTGSINFAFFLTISALEGPSSRPVNESLRLYLDLLRLWLLLYSSTMFETNCLCTTPRMEIATTTAGILQPSPPSTVIAHLFPAIHRNPVEFPGDDVYINNYRRNKKGASPGRSAAFSKSHEPHGVVNWRRGNCRGDGSRDLSVPQFPRTTTPPPQSSRNNSTVFQFKLHINCFRRFLSIRTIADPVVNRRL